MLNKLVHTTENVFWGGIKCVYIKNVLDFLDITILWY